MSELRKDAPRIQVVIGANYGDEGKGMMTDYFSRETKKGLVVLSNGGAQRGHTVETPEGDRVVFHHFGSGTLAGYDTYCPETFIINPAQFVQEKLSLKSSPRFLIHRNCRWSTPLDMILNQARLIKDGRTNSCGMGVWETIKRYDILSALHQPLPTLGEFAEMPLSEQDKVMALLADYFYEMIGHYEIDPSMNPKMRELFSFDLVGLCRHFIDDCQYMARYSKIVSCDKIGFRGYDSIIFENAQGLAIGKQVAYDTKNNTPTNTGLSDPLQMIEKCFDGCNVDVCYVSRTYLTRHGLGYLESECDPNQISMSISEDQTNIPNPFQGSIRYGRLNFEGLLTRIYQDYDLATEGRQGELKNHYTLSLALTHLNEYEPVEIDSLMEYAFQYGIDSIYLSDGKTYKDVTLASSFLSTIL